MHTMDGRTPFDGEGVQLGRVDEPAATEHNGRDSRGSPNDIAQRALDCVDVYKILDHPMTAARYGVWFSMDRNETYCAGLKICLDSFQQDHPPFGVFETNVIIPLYLSMGKA